MEDGATTEKIWFHPEVCMAAGARVRQTTISAPPTTQHVSRTYNSENYQKKGIGRSYEARGFIAPSFCRSFSCAEPLCIVYIAKDSVAANKTANGLNNGSACVIGNSEYTLKR